ncbi:glycosyltransferase [Halogeometricum limi]|uniref:Glycosyltransferase, catalytic subunit of cellulose synthase and poly-beta-1,6-N-acetylglucosamine synthase n=1 Tax=Halogeometricum limi TaxID=555875 RepID=A0A1I6GGL9_9EURY|nr:glycosyltransferase [Halogeometricum limi]SFR41373.1 Glycosyltransferase, catalytic subunit of cellulose synthase and poly-beta-1,6-N-acetylglucosamine synthase [Halogeometricum limi]
MRRNAVALGSTALAVCLSAIALFPYLLYLALFALLRPEGSPAEKGEWEPTVSVVVPTYNEAEIIETKLRDVLALDYPMEKVELVLADASDDGTPAVVRSFFEGRDAPSLTILHDDERRGVAPALNDAIRAASGEVVFRTDADSKLDPSVLRVAAANLADDAVGAVTGRQTDVIGDSDVEQDYRDMLSLVQRVESRLDSTFIFHGPCFAFRRDLFSPIAEDSLADDTEIALRIRRAGKRVVMDPTMQFAESGVSEFTKRRTRKDRRAMGLLQLLHRHADARFDSSLGLYGLVVLPANYLLMVVGPWLLLAAATLFTAGVFVLGGPFGLCLIAAFLAFGALGQRDALGPLQPVYAVLDAQASLLVAALRLRGDADGTWEIDRESRAAFESER